MIEVKKLTKRFGTREVVKAVSFTVQKGEILGFLGPNGAGKSTSMRMITGFLPPTSGTAVIGGSDITENSIDARKKIGYLPENAPVYQDMTVTGYLEFCAEIRGLNGVSKKSRVENILEKCFLTEVRHQSVNTLSKGFKQRVCFAQSIIHDPEYLILDEPTDGLDPNQKHEVRMMIRGMSQDKAIILSTHILDEVDAVCTRAIIIANGQIVADDTPEALRRRAMGHGAVTMQIHQIESPDQLISRLQTIDGVKRIEITEQIEKDLKIKAFPDKKDQTIAPQLVDALNQAQIAFDAVFVEQGRLEDVFRQITT